MIVKPPRIFIIDDDQVVLLLHKIQIKKQQLSEHIHLYSKANEALEALAHLDQEDQRILIFLDINMPEMNGWEFLHGLRDLIKKLEVKVIMVTSSLSLSDRNRSREFDTVIDFWEKPLAAEQLIQLKATLSDWLLGN